MTKRKISIEEQKKVDDRLRKTTEQLFYVQSQPYITHWTSTNINDLEGEVWIDIEGWEGKYKISNYERIKSLIRNEKGIILVQIIDNSTGYRFVNLSSPKAKKYPHRLIAQAFIPNTENLPCINHINGDVLDCRIINLEWCDKRHNGLHSYRILNRKDPPKKMGKDSPYSKQIVQKDIHGSVIKIWDSQSDIQRQTGISQSEVSACCRGIRMVVGGFKWEFKTESVCQLPAI